MVFKETRMKYDLTSISSILIMTLKSTPNRKWGCIGALEARGFPMEKVHAVHGIDGVVYASHDDIFEAAAADGFHFFKENQDFLRRPIPMVAGSWSACRVLRDIANQDQTVLLMEDDYFFRIDYDVILKRLELCCDHPINIAALIAKFRMDERLERRISKLNDFWIAGIPGEAPCASVYTPTGASYILDLFRKHKGTTLGKVSKDIEFPMATALLERRGAGKSAVYAGYSRADPETSSEAHVKAYLRWEKGLIEYQRG